MLKEYFDRQRQLEADLNFRHPWFNVMFNYTVAMCMICLVISLVIWGVDVHTERKAEAMTATALASWQAEQEEIQKAEAEQLAAQKASEDYIITQEAREVAKAFYGIRLFIERYGYDKTDLETYARVMFNRSEAKKTDLKTIIAKKDQFTGYSEDNLVLDVYYTPALEFVTTWHSEEVKPCDLSYQWAELTDKGIFLVNEFNADGYVRRWHS